jgi:hypothetical protein
MPINAYFARNVGKSIDNPRNLVVTAERQGVAAAGCLLIGQWLVRLVDDTKHVLTPGNQLAPNIDIVPHVWQAIAPSAQRALQFLDRLQLILHIGRADADINVGSLLNFHKRLQILQDLFCS